MSYEEYYFAKLGETLAEAHDRDMIEFFKQRARTIIISTSQIPQEYVRKLRLILEDENEDYQKTLSKAI